MYIYIYRDIRTYREKLNISIAPPDAGRSIWSIESAGREEVQGGTGAASRNVWVFLRVRRHVWVQKPISLVILYFNREPDLALQFFEISCNLFFGCKLMSIWHLSTCYNTAGKMHLSSLPLFGFARHRCVAHGMVPIQSQEHAHPGLSEVGIVPQLLEFPSLFQGNCRWKGPAWDLVLVKTRSAKEMRGELFARCLGAKIRLFRVWHPWNSDICEENCRSRQSIQGTPKTFCRRWCTRTPHPQCNHTGDVYRSRNKNQKVKAWTKGSTFQCCTSARDLHHLQVLTSSDKFWQVLTACGAR